MSIDEAASVMQGQSGSRVRLQLTSPAGDVRDATQVRRAVKVKSIPVAKIIDTATASATSR
jgi:C-terminal processing protease CtpA/Prc